MNHHRSHLFPHGINSRWQHNLFEHCRQYYKKLEKWIFLSHLSYLQTVMICLKIEVTITADDKRKIDLKISLKLALLPSGCDVMDWCENCDNSGLDEPSAYNATLPSKNICLSSQWFRLFQKIPAVFRTYSTRSERQFEVSEQKKSLFQVNFCFHEKRWAGHPIIFRTVLFNKLTTLWCIPFREIKIESKKKYTMRFSGELKGKQYPKNKWNVNVAQYRRHSLRKAHHNIWSC